MVADLRMASPAAVELVNPKHRNERKTHMALITSYHVPGLYVEDHSIDVPLDWRGLAPIHTLSLHAALPIWLSFV